jgi:Protein of unknown function (DUF4235)
MRRLLFLPFSLLAARLGGLLARRTFNSLWGLIDRRDPPESEERGVSLGRLMLALALQGAVFRAVAGAADHLARRAFLRLTGRWPGDEPETD